MRSVNEENTNIPEMHTFGKHKKNKPKTFLLLQIMYVLGQIMNKATSTIVAVETGAASIYCIAI